MRRDCQILFPQICQKTSNFHAPLTLEYPLQSFDEEVCKAYYVILLTSSKLPSPEPLLLCVADLGQYTRTYISDKLGTLEGEAHTSAL